MDTEYESAHKVDSGDENSPAASAGIRTRNLLIMSQALLSSNQEAVPAPQDSLLVRTPDS